MSADPMPLRTRGPAEPFRRVEVLAVSDVTPRLRRVTVGGPELTGLEIPQPAMSVRLYVPTPEAAVVDPIVLPVWDRNNFLLPDGARPTLRTLTPLRFDPDASTFDLEIVTHGLGPASTWAAAATPGVRTAMSGPARGWDPDAEAPAFLLAGDETAIPAIGQLLDVLARPPFEHTPVRVIVEVAAPEARGGLPERPDVEWLVTSTGPPGAALADAVRAVEVVPGTRVWAAGEAAAVQAIRRHLFDDLDVDRAHTWIRGYWKHDRPNRV